MANSPHCQLDETGSLTLYSILHSFNQPISEEQAWAVCYQTTKCFLKEWEDHPESCNCPTDTSELLIHKDGLVLCPRLKKAPKGMTTVVSATQYQLVSALGLLIFHALDFGLCEDEERNLTGPLEQLIDKMTSADSMNHQQGEDTPSMIIDGHVSLEDEHPDEGIERDSCEVAEITSNEVNCNCGQNKTKLTLSKVLEKCASQLPTPKEADAHYKAVCRALVAEALELSTFLEKIANGTQELRKCTELHNDPAESYSLDQLKFSDWARLWVQVIRELRNGVKLKKVDKTHCHRSIEYELTPYEILMDDIRSRRYKLNKVMINGNLPPRVKKDAHALILEFIRSRPPLVPANQRQLAPLPIKTPSAYENLMKAIRQEHHLKPSKGNTMPEMSVSADNTPQCQRRLIKADLNLLLTTLDDDDEEDDDYLFSPVKETKSLTPELSWQKTVALDLATQSNELRRPERRHSLTESDLPTQKQSRNHNAYMLSQNGSANDRSPNGFKYFQSAQTQNAMKCLSLTLEEVIHIRNVLTKAEMESLLVDKNVFEDVTKGKVCFGCRKTKFSLLKRGTKCKLCMQMVCEKCYSKMRIPTEHFENVPVYTLSPSSSTEEEYSSPNPTIKMSDISSFTIIGTGSAPSSPKFSKRVSIASDVSLNSETNKDSPGSPGKRSYQSSEGNQSPSSPTRMEKKRRPLFRSHTTSHQPRPIVEKRREDKIRGSLMNVCDDCKEMVKHVIIASRNINSKSTNKLSNNAKSAECPQKFIDH